MSSIGFIGLGWMGETVAKWCQENNMKVSGTTTSSEKNKIFQKVFDLSIVYNLSDSVEKLQKLKAVDYLFYSIPPSASEDYILKTKEVLNFCRFENSRLKLFYVSSTSVYGSVEREVTEESSTTPQTSNAKKIAEVEEFILRELKCEAVILRCGGLIGKQRHPAKFMAGKTNVSKPEAVVNLIHLADVLGFVKLQLAKFTPGVYNLVSPEHAIKSEYYGWAAEGLGLASIHFEPSTVKDKIVTCPAVNKLGYNYLFPSPYDYPLL